MSVTDHDLTVASTRPDLVVVHRDDDLRVHAPPPAAGRLRSIAVSGALAMLGVAAVVALWQLLSAVRPDLPSPADAFAQFRSLLGGAFVDGGPNGKGIALQLGASLRKVFTGFALAACIGIPIGFVIGASRTAWRALNPIVQLLRPVSPLAWFPIALVLFKDTSNAAVFTIAITALWPTLINTAMGAASVPEDHRNVARVFRFSRSGYVRHVLIPWSMQSVVTGLRLSMGIAWMVIVATEMLSGSTGVGFFVWDSYNNNLEAVISAIVLIGAIGLVLDAAFQRLARRFDYSTAEA